MPARAVADRSPPRLVKRRRVSQGLPPRQISGPWVYASLFMAGLIVVPQIVVAILSPWVGYHSEKWGRKPLLLLGFGLDIIRSLLFAFSANVWVLFTAQLLSGISAAA